jgi:hypothetical protein
VEVRLHYSLGIRWKVIGQIHAPAAVISGNESPSTHWIGGPVGPRTGPDAAENRNFLPLPGIEPFCRPAHLPVHCTDLDTAALSS